MFCGKCGTENPDDMKHCYKCGALLFGHDAPEEISQEENAEEIQIEEKPVLDEDVDNEVKAEEPIVTEEIVTEERKGIPFPEIGQKYTLYTPSEDEIRAKRIRQLWCSRGIAALTMLIFLMPFVIEFDFHEAFSEILGNTPIPPEYGFTKGEVIHHGTFASVAPYNGAILGFIGLLAIPVAGVSILKPNLLPIPVIPGSLVLFLEFFRCVRNVEIGGITMKIPCSVMDTTSDSNIQAILCCVFFLLIPLSFLARKWYKENKDLK